MLQVVARLKSARSFQAVRLSYHLVTHLARESVYAWYRSIPPRQTRLYAHCSNER